jgi:hypothetical protein
MLQKYRSGLADQYPYLGANSTSDVPPTLFCLFYGQSLHRCKHHRILSLRLLLVLVSTQFLSSALAYHIFRPFEHDCRPIHKIKPILCVIQHV